MSADGIGVGLQNLAEPQPQLIGDNFGIDENTAIQEAAWLASLPQQAIAVPDEIGDEVALTLEINGSEQTLLLGRHSVRSSNFQVFTQEDDGTLVQYDTSGSGTYRGVVLEDPSISVYAVVSSRGLTAHAYYSDGSTAWSTTPLDRVDANGDALHAVINDSPEIQLSHDHDGDGIADHAAHAHHASLEPFMGGGGGHEPGCTCEQCCPLSAEPSDNAAAVDSTPVVETVGLPEPVIVNNGADKADRAVVFNNITVKEAVVGFDVTNEALSEGYGNNVQAVLDNIEFFLNTNEAVNTPPEGGTRQSPNTIYLRDGLVHQVAGTILIRTSVAADPYADANGDSRITAGNDGDPENLLGDFQNRWNNNLDIGLIQPGERIQSNHDLATLLGGSGGTADGWAFVGTVGEGARYSISDGTSRSFWRSIARHELGHTWGLSHNHGRFETDPGGNGIGIMSGGLHNRLNTDESIRVLQERDEASSNLQSIGAFTEHNVRPFAKRDDVTLNGSSVVIDVLANDYDANNDALFLDQWESISDNGGTISLSLGTGNLGQDELIYTAPPGFSGEDTFYYFIGDVEQFGGSDWIAYGQVTVTVVNPEILVDINDTRFNYDVGTPSSPILGGGNPAWVRLSPDTTGDVFWSNTVNSVDRGSIPGVNDINRDLVFSNVATTLEHKVQNGIWRVVLNMGDANFLHDDMGVRAEGQLISDNIDSPIGQFSYVSTAGGSASPTSFDISVTDGSLSLEFFDNGGADINWVLTRMSLELVQAFQAPLLAGDYNLDGIVNTADYVVWRNTLGDTVANPFDGADSDGSGVIDEGDYGIWRSNFGASLVTTTLIDANTGNGEFNFDNANDAQSVGGGPESIVTNTGRDRAFRDTSAGGRGLAVPGWELTRVSYPGSNAALGLDGNYGFAPTSGTAPGLTGQAFVNSGVIDVTSDTINYNFSPGDRIDLSYLLGSDANGATETAEATVTLTFDEGLPTQTTHTFQTHSGTGLTTPAIVEEYMVTSAASSVSINFLLDGLVSGRRALLDRVELSVVSSPTNNVSTGNISTGSVSSGLLAENSASSEPQQQQVSDDSPRASLATLPAGEASVAEETTTILLSISSQPVFLVTEPLDISGGRKSLVLDRQEALAAAVGTDDYLLNYESDTFVEEEIALSLAKTQRTKDISDAALEELADNAGLVDPHLGSSRLG